MQTNNENGWRQPLVLALCASLLLHLAFYGTWRIGRELGWWNVSLPFLSQLLNRLNSMLVSPKQIQEALERQQQRTVEETPITFVDVAPQQATADKPEKAQFYGPLNAIAASKEASEKDADRPKVDGQQDKEFKTFDVPRNLPEPVANAQPNPPPPAKTETAAVNPDKLQPSPEPEAKAPGKPDAPEVPVAEAKAEKPGAPEPLLALTPITPKPGDLTRAPVSTQPEKGNGAVRKGAEGDASEPRPRTITQARAQLPQDSGIPGERMKVEGASRLQHVMASFNTEGTIWGSYDAKLIAIIKNQWYHFLDLHPEAFNWAGRVVVVFHLQYDGRVTDFKIIENTSGEMQGYGAQKAIMRDFGQPYDPWPPSARHMTDKDYRELRFTFYYN